MKMHSLKVLQVETLTPLSKKITFHIPQEIQNNFKFISGQYVSLDLMIDGHAVKRSYSICSDSQHMGSISVGVKQIENGYVSVFLNQNISSGQTISVSEPDGNFIIDSNQKNHVFVAGGSGITPFMSMLYALLPDPNTNIYLKYSTLSQVETMFYEELQALNEKYSNFHLDLIYTNGENLLNEVNLASWIESLNLKNFGVYVCGPNGIIKATELACNAMGLNTDNFHREYFTAKSAEDMESASVGNTGQDDLLQPGEVATVEMKSEGKKITFNCKYNETVLDAALNAGGDPPYSCLVAACSTCRAMVKSGSVEMRDRDALSDKEIAKGFVLTCQAMPRSKNIVLDYDE
jgi:ring-1,2-phenylacetyl-CoA epoxidase subunit PaaE